MKRATCILKCTFESTFQGFVILRFKCKSCFGVLHLKIIIPRVRLFVLLLKINVNVQTSSLKRLTLYMDGFQQQLSADSRDDKTGNGKPCWSRNRWAVWSGSAFIALLFLSSFLSEQGHLLLSVTPRSCRQGTNLSTGPRRQFCFCCFSALTLPVRSAELGFYARIPG